MAGKSNAKPAKQAEPAKDAAMAEATGGAAEQNVTPPVPDGRGGGEAVNPEQVQGGEGAEDFDTAMWFPSPAWVEDQARFNPEHVREFFQTAFRGLALMLGEAGVRVRRNGEEPAPLPEDILAVSLRQGEAVFVLVDGRKYKLKGESIHEA